MNNNNYYIKKKEGHMSTFYSKAEEAYIKHLHSSDTKAEEAYLAHHGILGMKWGVRRFQNKDGTLTSKGKKRYSESNKPEEEKTSLEASLEADGYTKNVYGDYEKLIKSPNKNIKSLSIQADISSGFGEKMSDDDYKALLKSIETNYNDIQTKIAKSMADAAFNDDGREPWLYENSNLPISEQRKRFADRLGTRLDYESDEARPGQAYIRVMADGYGEYGIDDGGAYWGHWLTTELDWKKEWKNPKVKLFSVEG